MQSDRLANAVDRQVIASSGLKRDDTQHMQSIRMSGIDGQELVERCLRLQEPAGLMVNETTLNLIAAPDEITGALRQVGRAHLLATLLAVHAERPPGICETVENIPTRTPENSPKAGEMAYWFLCRHSREGGRQEIRFSFSWFSVSSFPRKREPSDFSCCSGSPLSRGRRYQGVGRLGYSLEGGNPVGFNGFGFRLFASLWPE
jgi:hypothetical protein